MERIEKEVKRIQKILENKNKDKLWTLCIDVEPITSIVSKYGETKDYYYIEITVFQGLRLFNKAGNIIVQGFFPILNPCNGILTNESKDRLIMNLKEIKEKLLEPVDR